MDCQPSDWLAGSFFRSPAWRLLRASYRLKNSLAADPAIDDAGVAMAQDLLASIDAHDLDNVPHAVRAAYDVWAADRVPRALLEAQLLTPRTFEEIAAECSLSEPTVHAFHQLFFDVRSRPQATDWLLAAAVRSHPLNDFAGPQPAGILKFFAFTGGSEVLDVVAAVICDGPLPDWLRRQLTTNPRVEEQRLRLKVKLAIAALTAKGAAQLGSVVELAEQLRGLDKEAGVPVNHADSLTPVVGAFFAKLIRPHHAEPGPEAFVRVPSQDRPTNCEQARPEPIPVETDNGGDRDR